MRFMPVLLVLLLATSCGEGGDRGSDRGQDRSAPAGTANEAADGLTSGGPDVAPTGAPGVAFSYRYAFRLAAQRVSSVQEQHARMCEQLGPNRCRITGMRYRVVSEEDVEGRLVFRVEPGIARRFGQLGVEAVARSEGMLAESEITGTDAGSTIRQAGKSVAELTADLRRIETQLARPGTASEERARLDYEAQQLRASIRAAQDTRQEAQDSLATTPMTFEYGSGDVAPGFDNRKPLGRAAEEAWDNFLSGLAVLFVILATLLPWAVLALLVWLVVRWIRRRGWLARPAAGIADDQ
jgi:hypothetical protein